MISSSMTTVYTQAAPSAARAASAKGSLPCQTHLVNGELRLGGALGGVKEKLLISANRFAIEVGRMTLGT